MNLLHRLVTVLVLAIVVSCTTDASALVSVSQTGTWPTNWPKELEPFRKQARTIGVATGLQENIYEIRFANRSEFEKVWPAILRLKTPLAPITLYRTNNSTRVGAPFFTNDHPAIRLRAPCEAIVGGSSLAGTTAEQTAELLEQGKMLKAGPPWPAAITAIDGALPEYVGAKQTDGKCQWVPADLDTEKKRPTGFLYRARVDLEIIHDGNIIDITRLQFPSYTVINDDRLPVPDLTKQQVEALVADVSERRYGPADRNHWSPTLRNLNPLRVEKDRTNVKVVLVEAEGMEAGFYVTPGISSYTPEPSKFFELAPVHFFLFRYKLVQSTNSLPSKE